MFWLAGVFSSTRSAVRSVPGNTGGSLTSVALMVTEMVSSVLLSGSSSPSAFLPSLTETETE